MIFKYDSCPSVQSKAAPTPTPLPFSVLMNRKFSAFISNKALPLLILNKVDFTSHPKRQDSSSQSSMFSEVVIASTKQLFL